MSGKKTVTVLSIRISEEIKDKIDKLFIDLPDRSDRVRFIINDYFKLIETFPYLNANQKLVRPEDASFPPCPFVMALYDGDKFVGFHCLLRNCPLDLPRIRIGKRTLKIATSESCWTCVEVCKKAKIGLDIFKDITLGQIDLHKELLKAVKPEERRVIEILEEAGLRMDYPTAKAIFQSLKRMKNGRWRGFTRASKKLGISRTTIYRLIDALPEGVR